MVGIRRREREVAATAVDLWCERAPLPLHRAAKVADLGRGDLRVGEILSTASSHPIDLIDVNLRTPVERIDAAFALGVMDSLNDPRRLLARLRAFADTVVFSYGHVANGGVARFWRGNHTEAEILDFALETRYRVLESKEVRGRLVVLACADPPDFKPSTR